MVMRVLRGGGSPLTEDEPVASKLFAPSSLITSPEKGGAKTMGRAAEDGTPDRLVLGHIDGDNLYYQDVEHRERAHPGEPLLTEREYWRMRHDAIETNPNPRRR